MIKENSYEEKTCCTNVDVFTAYHAQKQTLDAKHWTYKRKRLRSEKINQKKKINANSEGGEFISYSEVWCQSEGRRRHTYAAERAG